MRYIQGSSSFGLFYKRAEKFVPDVLDFQMPIGVVKVIRESQQVEMFFRCILEQSVG